MRVIRRIASTGRTCVSPLRNSHFFFFYFCNTSKYRCVTTIHQPSAEVYSNFDDLLLMQRGGYQAYYGPCGDAFQAFITDLPGAHPLPLGMNPASWMLDVLAVRHTPFH